MGKTTTTVNLAIGLARAGYRTLVVDLDPRTPAATHLGMSSTGELQSQAQRTYVAMCEIAVIPDAGDAESSGGRLDCLLRSTTYDYVLLDCPPTIDGATRWALERADDLLMPVRCDHFGLEGVPDLVGALRHAIADGSEVDFSGVLLTYQERTDQGRDAEQEARDFFGEVMFESVVPFDPSIEDARREHQAVMDVMPRSRGARAYVELCREVIER